MQKIFEKEQHVAALPYRMLTRSFFCWLQFILILLKDQNQSKSAMKERTAERYGSLPKS